MKNARISELRDKLSEYLAGCARARRSSCTTGTRRSRESSRSRPAARDTPEWVLDAERRGIATASEESADGARLPCRRSRPTEAAEPSRSAPGRAAERAMRFWDSSAIVSAARRTSAHPLPSRRFTRTTKPDRLVSDGGRGRPRRWPVGNGRASAGGVRNAPGRRFGCSSERWRGGELGRAASEPAPSGSSVRTRSARLTLCSSRRLSSSATNRPEVAPLRLLRRPTLGSGAERSASGSFPPRARPRNRDLLRRDVGRRPRRRGTRPLERRLVADAGARRRTAGVVPELAARAHLENLPAVVRGGARTEAGIDGLRHRTSSRRRPDPD